MPDEQPVQPIAKSEPLSLPVEPRLLDPSTNRAGQAYRAAMMEDVRKRGQVAIDEQNELRLRLRKTIADNAARFEGIGKSMDRINDRLFQPPVIPYIEQMRSAEANREIRDRQIRRAAKKIDELILWSYRDKNRRKKAFDAIVWPSSKTPSDLNDVDDVITQAVLARHFNYSGKRYEEEPEDASVAEAERRVGGIRRGKWDTCVVVFTPEGLKHGKSLYRQKVSWLRFLPTAKLKTVMVTAIASLGFLAGILGNLDKIGPWLNYGWQSIKNWTH